MEHQPLLKDKHILFVEDNDISCEIATHLLGEEGATVDIAHNGTQALRRLHSSAPSPYDIILMSMQLPDCSGTKISQDIRINNTAKRLPIIAIAENDDQATRAEIAAAGINTLLTFPLNFNEVINCIMSFDSLPTPVKRTTDSIAVQDDDKITVESMETILPRFGDDIALYTELALEFEEDVTGVLNSLAQHLKQAEHAAILRALHTLKGNAATIGLTSLSTNAANIEHTIKTTEESEILLTRFADIWLAELTRLSTESMKLIKEQINLHQHSTLA